MITPIILFLVGLVLLIKGGDWFVAVSYTHLSTSDQTAMKAAASASATPPKNARRS